MTLAAMLGFLVIAVILVVLSISIIGGLASSLGEKTPVMPREAVLMIDMSKIAVTEQSEPDDPVSLSLLTGGSSYENFGIRTLIRAIDAAGFDPAVKFIYLKVDGTSGETAGIEEFRTALRRFRITGKPIIAFTETPTNGSYYLASVADKIYMENSKGGMNTLTGFASNITYLKDILDKLGVNVQLIRHGKYKSAGETYIRSTISEENREQYQELLNSLWGSWGEEMAAARGLTLEQLNSLIDNLELNSPQDFLDNHLVDELLDMTEREQKIADLFGKEKFSDVKFIGISDYAKLKVTSGNSKSKEAIAIIYANGEITDGAGTDGITGDRFANIIAKVRRDSTIKAVVFRVNSPGGSVTASEKIKKEIDRLREVKPVVASYGSYAASGGYWISNSCDRIFADASTLTGSIGVFSMIPDFSGTAKKVGINIETVSSNKHGDMLSGMRPLDKDELAYMQESVEDIYDEFTSIVARGRNLDQKYVDEIAQGRVWSGKDALKIGLVDEIGGLDEALHAAMFLSSSTNSDLSTWKIVEYPTPRSTMDMLMEKLGQSSSVFAGTPFEQVERTFKTWNDSQTGKAYAMMPYVLEIQ